jgi:hypothetical protein
MEVTRTAAQAQSVRHELQLLLEGQVADIVSRVRLTLERMRPFFKDQPVTTAFCLSDGPQAVADVDTLGHHLLGVLPRRTETALTLCVVNHRGRLRRVVFDVRPFLNAALERASTLDNEEGSLFLAALVDMCGELHCASDVRFKKLSRRFSKAAPPTGPALTLANNHFTT